MKKQVMRTTNKTERLSDKDIEKLKYDLRPGIIFGTMIGIFSLTLIIVIDSR